METMTKRQRIPIRVMGTNEHKNGSSHTGTQREVAQNDAQHHAPEPERKAAPAVEMETSTGSHDVAGESASRSEHEVNEWRDRALRLQAEMENFRKRQQRLVQEQNEAERQRLLGAFLEVIDDLERALAVESEGEGLRQGVELTHRAATQLLQREGVEPIRAGNKPFDPNWHEAVATAATNGSGVAPNTVVQVMEPGYRVGNQLLRPAKVIVAV
jgi:molecular chaperone GrpE